MTEKHQKELQELIHKLETNVCTALISATNAAADYEGEAYQHAVATREMLETIRTQLADLDYLLINPEG